MKLKKLLIANRGEVAVRILRAAGLLHIPTVAVYSADDSHCLHVRRADSAIELAGRGSAAYLDTDALIAIAVSEHCDALHPGYGFLAESAELARRCRQAGITFVGPTPEVLETLGDKVRARELATAAGIPVARGVTGNDIAEDAHVLFDALPTGSAIIIKAVAGGGGRGMRLVRDTDDIDAAIERASSEAAGAFGNGAVYAEEVIPNTRHIEVQIIGDKTGNVTHLWERECSIQRRHQKLAEIAPSPSLDGALREEIIAAATTLASSIGYTNIGTFEFLVPCNDSTGHRFVFIEANPRLQVEHTITEMITGVDLVQTQLQLAAGGVLSDLGLSGSPQPPRGMALQLRINTETMDASGEARAGGGTLTAFEPASGPGVRVDSYGYAGYTTNPAFDSLLAKVISHAPSAQLTDVAERAYRALCESRIEGVTTNVPFLLNLLKHPDFLADRIHTRFVDEHLGELTGENGSHPRLFFAMPDSRPGTPTTGRAGATVDAVDPLAVLDHGKSEATLTPKTPLTPAVPPRMENAEPANLPDLAAGTLAVTASMQGTIVSVDVSRGSTVGAGATLLIMEAMKMEHVISTPVGGIVQSLDVAAGDTVYDGQLLARVERADVAAPSDIPEDAANLARIRPDLEEVLTRHEIGLDPARPAAVARRRKTQQRTARENIEDLCDADSFTEYGPIVIAAQRKRRSIEDLVENTPADGMIAGVGTVNGDLFDESRARCAVVSYDYTVLAGTQGLQNHRKKDRLFEIAEHARLPLVVFTEGGGGRPGDTDSWGGSGLDCMAFKLFGGLSGLVPLVGINSGRCFAGNAALLGCCDVVIATENSNIGMGGPAMVEGGGLGVFKPEEIGPIDVQTINGVVDIAVADEAAAVAVAKRYLSYFQGPLGNWQVVDQRNLRTIIPENRLRVYDVRRVIDAMADTNSVLELRRDFGHGMVTALARIEGRPIGIVANNPLHLAGAIDSPGADKAARFMQLCDAFDIPVLFLCDTPGIMVGPESETTALVRHASRMFVIGASMTVPFFTIVLRKGYGLGAQAMAGGSFKAGSFLVAWPTGEFGGMGLEGAVKLGFRKELAAIEDPSQRRKTFDEMVAKMYEYGKAVNTASHFEIDDVIDPADSRRWIMSALRSAPPAPPRSGKKRPCIDTW
jgi:acetyl/propionyl-CoA carboxylase alpha subunit